MRFQTMTENGPRQAAGRVVWLGVLTMAWLAFAGGEARADEGTLLPNPPPAVAAAAPERAVVQILVS
jgi:hypothetical protein